MNKTIFKSGNILFFFFIITCLLSRLNSGFFFIDILGQLGFQILIGGVVLFFILFFLKRFWASVICIFICVLFSADILLSCNRCKSSLIDELQSNNKIHLMTFNISYTNPVSNFENIKEMILSENPDVIRFQEFSPQMLVEIKSLKSIFPYSTDLNKPMDRLDSVILSKHPLTSSRTEVNKAVLTTLNLNETEITLVGIHLLPGRTQEHFNLALGQADYLKTLINDINENIILIGDLNMTSTSRRFSKFLKDTNLYTAASYTKPTSTWPAFLPNFLGIQLEHVLFSNNFKLINKKTANNFGSDHRPLIVALAY